MRYAYRIKGQTGRVTMDYAAKAPATSALYQHIRYLAFGKARQDGNEGRHLSQKEVKEIAARDYELITYVLMEEPELKSLQRDSNWLNILDRAGIDNSEAYSYAFDVKREAIADGEYTEEDFD